MHDSAWAAGPTPRHPSMEEDHTERYRDLGTPFTPADTPGAGIVSTPGLDAGEHPSAFFLFTLHFRQSVDTALVCISISLGEAVLLELYVLQFRTALALPKHPLDGMCHFATVLNSDSYKTSRLKPFFLCQAPPILAMA